jgi:hypothetical protein
VVIVLGMGSAKKKPMTKKEREEKRRKHKEKQLKKSIAFRLVGLDDHAHAVKFV